MVLAATVWVTIDLSSEVYEGPFVANLRLNQAPLRTSALPSVTDSTDISHTAYCAPNCSYGRNGTGFRNLPTPSSTRQLLSAVDQDLLFTPQARSYNPTTARVNCFRVSIIADDYVTIL